MIICKKPDTFPEKCCVFIYSGNNKKKIEFSNNAAYITNVDVISALRHRRWQFSRQKKRGEYLITSDTIAIDDFPYHLYRKISKLIKRVAGKRKSAQYFASVGVMEVSFKNTYSLVQVWYHYNKKEKIDSLSAKKYDFHKEYDRFCVLTQSIVDLLETNEIFKNKNKYSYTKYWNEKEYLEFSRRNVVDTTVWCP